jgi:hypothetical protein
MTRKDYVLIAEVLHKAYVPDMIDYEMLVEDFANALAGTNPLFNREIFFKACGIVEAN